MKAAYPLLARRRNLYGQSSGFATDALAVSEDDESHLGTTNSRTRMRTRCVTHWRDVAVGLYWFAVRYLEIGKLFRRIMGYEHLWQLKTKLPEIAELRLERLQSTPPVSDGCAVPLTQEAVKGTMLSRRVTGKVLAIFGTYS